MPEPFAYLLHQALEAEIGVKVSTDNPKLLRQRLYAVRKANFIFTDLAFVIPATPNEVWIMKKTENPE